MNYQYNYFAIFTMALVNVVLGGVWYAPKVFGDAWSKLAGMTQEKAKKGAGKALAWMVAMSILQAFVLSAVVQWVQAGTGGLPLNFFNGLMVGFYAWLGFTFTVVSSSYQFNQHPLKLYLIDLGYPLISMLVMGGVLAVWK